MSGIFLFLLIQLLGNSENDIFNLSNPLGASFSSVLRLPEASDSHNPVFGILPNALIVAYDMDKGVTVVHLLVVFSFLGPSR